MGKNFDEFEEHIGSEEMELEKDSIYKAVYEADVKRRECKCEEDGETLTFIDRMLARDRATAAVSRFELRKYHEWLNN